MKKLTLAVYLLFALSVAVTTFYFISLSYHLGPFRDMWIAMDFIRSVFERSSTPVDFFSLHGGAHRLAIPRLFFLIEYGVFSGSNVFLILTSVVVQLSMVGLIWYALKQEAHIPKSCRWLLTAMTLVLMFNATQLENFIYTFDMQWFVTAAAATWALYFWNQFIKNFTEQQFISVRALTLSLLLTAVSMLSSFSGLCLLLVLPPLALAYRLPSKQVFVSMLLIAWVITCYMSGPFGVGGIWATEDASWNISTAFQSLFNIILLWLKWTALYFSAPLGREYFWPAALLSYGSLFFIAWQWLQVIRKGVSGFTSFQMFALSLALFAAIVGISTGLGRMYFVNTADEDRYQSIVALYWLGVFAFSLSRALQIEAYQKISCYKHACIAVIVFWTVIVLPVFSIRDAQAQVNFFDRVNSANLAVATGQWDYAQIKDTLILGDKWKKINRPEQHAAFLRDKKWGVFADPSYALLDITLDQQYISADRCEGRVDTIDAVPAPYRGYRIMGQGLDVIDETLLKNYLAIDAQGKVVGIGRLQRQKNSLLPITWQPADTARWLLYTTDIVEPQALHILGVLDDGAYCTMASARLNR